MTVTIESLRKLYEADRALTSFHAYWDVGDPDAPPNLCRYCGKHWARWVGSKLDGHSACMVTDDFRQTLRELCWGHPEFTHKVLAEALGVSCSVVRMWLQPILDKHQRLRTA